MKKLITVLLLIFSSHSALFGQGYNHQWLIGYWPIPFDKGRISFDASSYILNSEQRKMEFWGTEGNICDSNGNFLMSSNGIWITNANNDTMMNGSGLNPGGITPSWPNGLPLTANNVFVPFPGDSNKYVLFHHTATYNGIHNYIFELYMTVIDMNLDNGLGGVIQKNLIILQDTLSCGIVACKHANGRDWWIIMKQDSTDIIMRGLLDASGLITFSNQSLLFAPIARGNVIQLSFSPDGTKFISTTYDNPVDRNSYLVICDFDRCTGVFSNTQTIQLTNNAYLWGLAFSPSGKYAYACSSNEVFQIDTDNMNVTTVATYDGFLSPGPNCCATSFWNMYLAANGKIYITSGSGVQHIHEMNYPDSAGVACDVQQHAISLGYAQLRAVPNHPNYYLGAADGTICDSLGLNPVNEITHDFNFSLSPNPNYGNFKIIYLLPQNKTGKLEVFDINDRMIYQMTLPPWSTLQEVSLPENVAGGVYNCVVSSDGYRAFRKLVVVKE